MTFQTGFDRYAIAGDTITCTVEGFDVTARLEHDSDRHIDDDDCHPAEFNADMFGEDTPASRACFGQALAVRNAWFRDEWHYVGVVLSVSKRGITLDRHAASLWGIECNYPGGDNSYLTEVANELLPEALAEGKKQLAKLCTE
jgi:hypothetical protein